MLHFAMKEKIMPSGPGEPGQIPPETTYQPLATLHGGKVNHAGAIFRDFLKIIPFRDMFYKW
jgi:hypothetical protein